MDRSSWLCPTEFLGVEVVLLSMSFDSEVWISGVVWLGKPPGLDGLVILICCHVSSDSSILLVCLGRADGLKASFSISALPL